MAEEKQEKQVKHRHITPTRKIALLTRRVDELETGLNSQLYYSRGFYDGRRYIVSEAEAIMSQNNVSKPAWWIAILVKCLIDPHNVYMLPKKQEPDESDLIIKGEEK